VARLARGLAAVVLLLALGSLPAAADYRVILKDGSWLRAYEKPEVVDGKARIRLLAGQYTELPEGRIDWRASDAWNRQPAPPAAAPKPDVLPAPAKPVPRSIRIVGEPPAAPAPAASPAAASPPAAAPPPPEAPDEPNLAAQNRRRIRELDQEIETLRQKKADLERRAENAIRVEDSQDLRRQAQDVQSQIQAKRAEQNRLILQLPGRRR
jgi:hypothetical protein